MGTEKQTLNKDFSTSYPTKNIPLGDIVSYCHQSSVGKLLPRAFYVHTSALPHLDEQLQSYEQRAREITSGVEDATLVKFFLEQAKISYLFYPEFDTEAHPALHTSIQVDLNNCQVRQRNFSQLANPPILHRKETFVTPDYPLYQQFARLTHQEEVLGLLENSRFIGTRRQWLQRLRHHRITIEKHYLLCPLDSGEKLEIQRHRAAIYRNQISRPVRLAIDTDILTPQQTFFDYGCGHGEDVKRLAKQGYNCAGWDPYYSPKQAHLTADVVNLGYVINVIEDTAERREALLKAWELTRQVLIVSAQVLIDDSSRGVVVYSDGIVTSRNTFQKYYQQEELKIYIDQVLQVDAIPVGLGVYFVFRDQTQAQAFRASRVYSGTSTPRIRTKVKRFEDYEQLLTPLMAFVTKRGRLPAKGELATEAEIKAEFSSFRRAFQVILQVTEEKDWAAIADQRRQDLTLFIALSNFSYRPKMRDLPALVKEDIKALFGSYKKACLLADMMLFSLKDRQNIADLCASSSVGYKSGHTFLVHISALSSLDPLLRLYEGCASRTIGRWESTNVIKFYLRQPKIAYLYYPNFDSTPHPLLEASMKIDLRDLHVSRWEYNALNPPILHRKDTLVTPSYPLYEKFARLTRQEEDWGLLDNLTAVCHQREWLKCLEDHCAILEGHQLRWRKDADPYKVKVQRAAMQRANRRRKKISNE